MVNDDREYLLRGLNHALCLSCLTRKGLLLDPEGTSLIFCCMFSSHTCVCLPRHRWYGHKHQIWSRFPLLMLRMQVIVFYAFVNQLCRLSLLPRLCMLTLSFFTVPPTICYLSVFKSTSLIISLFIFRDCRLAIGLRLSLALDFLFILSCFFSEMPDSLLCKLLSVIYEYQIL